MQSWLETQFKSIHWCKLIYIHHTVFHAIGLLHGSFVTIQWLKYLNWNRMWHKFWLFSAIVKELGKFSEWIYGGGNFVHVPISNDNIANI